MNLPYWISQKAGGALDPERVQVALASIAEAWPADYPVLPELLAAFPAGEAAFLHLLAVSPISTEKIVKDPDALLWLADPAVTLAPRGIGKMRSELKADRGAFDPNFRALRKAKGREMLRIALREVAGISSVEQTTLELSHLAELCVREVTDGWLAELGRRWKTPDTDFAVLGMGKFGGMELNYSSDIDVIFIYDQDGWINPNFSYHEFFTRLAQKIIATFSTADAAGSLFRIDLRLRPEGIPGPLVRSMESTENYYAGHGETWERMALIKARGVGGSAALAYEFAQRLQPFVFPRTLSTDFLDEVAAIKVRIERDIVGQAELHRNVKLGYGGIREIEFVVQTIQLTTGARHAFLQERNTLKTLRGLRELELLPGDDVLTLSEAYRFLRTVEHRLQIEREAQTHTIPDKPEAVARLARSLGFGSGDAFQAELSRHTKAVRVIFDRTLRASNGNKQPAAQERDLSFFPDPADAQKMLNDLAHGESLGHVAPRTRKLTAKLEPLLLDWLRKVAAPDLALARFVRFVERYGIRGTLFEALVMHPRLLELLIRLFDSSRFMTDIVLRRPGLIEEIAREGLLGKTFTVADYLEGLERNDEGLPWADWVRAYRRSQLLRIFLRDVLQFATLEQVHAEYSGLAEACIVDVQKHLGLADSLTVIAMGKFGGRELSYGADLDVIFVGGAPDGAASLVKAMTSTTTEGIIFPVDARLRPEGNSGLLTMPLSSFDTYFHGRAQFWEAQALTKARAISGPLAVEFDEWAQQTWRRYATQPDAVEQVKAMHARVVKERASADPLLDFKTGRGGLMEAEFGIQAMQMKHQVWQQNAVAAIQALAEAGALNEAQSADLKTSYLFLRKVESVIRRVENSSVSTLPKEENEQRQVAIRMRLSGREEFLEQYNAAREKIHEVIETVW